MFKREREKEKERGERDTRNAGRRLMRAREAGGEIHRTRASQVVESTVMAGGFGQRASVVACGLVVSSTYCGRGYTVAFSS